MSTLLPVALLLALPRVTNALRAPILTAPAAEANATASEVGDAIPNVIYFTGPWVPMQVVERWLTVVTKGTEFRFYYYTDLERSVDEISASLEKVGVSGARQAFYDLRPRAYRADLWRYMVLWQSGGIYVDAKMALRAPVSSWVDLAHDSFAACYDVSPGQYMNGLLAARKHDPTLLAVIRRIISNVQDRYYPPASLHADLNITGPGALTSVLLGGPPERRPRAGCRLKVLSWRPKNIQVVALPTHEVLADLDEREHEAMRHCPECDDYGPLFAQHMVYCSEAGPKCNFSLPTPPRPAGFWSYVA
jgi:hypothetical protein